MTPHEDPAPVPAPRAPLDHDRLRRALADASLPEPGARVELLDVCESTNVVAAGLPATATADADWALVAAEQQTAGRGRLGRRWESPPGAGLLFSVLLTVPPGADPALVGLLPLAAGVAVADACRAAGSHAVGLKWPNDVVVEPGPGVEPPLAKLGGLLAERSPRGVVVGVGLNITLTAEEAPTAEAASLADHGLRRTVSREELLASCTAGIVHQWRHLHTGGRASLLDRYREQCLTVGSPVAVTYPDGTEVTGTAIDIDADGHLLVATAADEVRVLNAGDVRHLRGLAG